MSGPSGSWRAGSAPLAAGAGPAPPTVLVAVEQLRRRVPGGVGTYARGLLGGIRALAEEGRPIPDVVLLASRPPHGGAPGDDPVAAAGFPVRTVGLGSRLLTRAWDHGLFPAPGPYDVLHAVSLAVPPVGRAAHRGATGAPTPVQEVVTVHDLAWRQVPEAFPRRGRRWHEAAFRRALRRRAHIVVSSAEVAADVVAAGADAAGVTVISAGADHLPEPDARAAGALLRRLGVDGDYLLCVGTLEPRKNVARLIVAYERIRPGLPAPWPLVVVGPTGWGPHVAPAPGVVLTGPVDAAVLAGLYARARAFAYVPLVEGFGIPPIEAMRHGVPVVASPVPSAGAAVVAIDPYDTASIAEGLRAAGTDEALRRRLAEEGRRHAARFTWRNCAAAHIALWERLSGAG